MIKKQRKYNLRWLTTSNYYHTITPVIQLSTVSEVNIFVHTLF